MIRLATTMILLLVAVLTLSPSALAMKCSERLEPALQALPEWMTTWTEESEDDVPQACIHRAMGVFHEWTHSVRQERRQKGQREIGHYAYCSTDGSDYVRSHNPPCASDIYLNTISNTYNSTLKCLGFQPRHLFAITAVESGFQINTLSIAGIDIGIGQITPVAVDDVNPHWQEYKQRIASSNNPHCANIKDMVANLSPAGDSLTCDLTALPLNPVRNLIYLSFLHFKNHSYLEQVFVDQGLFEAMEQLSGRPYSDSEKQRILDMMLALSYNAGSVGSVEALKAFMATRSGPIRQLQEQITVLENQKVTLYLNAEDLSSKGKTREAQALLEQREQIDNGIGRIREQMNQIRIPLNDFAITDKTTSFGYYLKSTETSFYLDILQGRIDYVEASIGKEGQCATRNYLQSLAD